MQQQLFRAPFRESGVVDVAAGDQRLQGRIDDLGLDRPTREILGDLRARARRTRQVLDRRGQCRRRVVEGLRSGRS